MELSERYGLAVDPDAVVEDLPVGVQQRVEILKALYRDAQLPHPRRAHGGAHAEEIDELMGIIRQLADGRPVDHLHHPQAARGARRSPTAITVLRGGKVVGDTTPGRDRRASAGHDDGRATTCSSSSTRRRPSPATPVLEVDDLVVADDRGQRAVDGVTFDVRAGEILAVAGVQGNGQTELVEAITGLRPPIAGHGARSTART